MYEAYKKYIMYICAACLLLAACIGGWWLYTDSRTTADYHHVNDAVGDAQMGIDRAGSGLADAAREVENAEGQLNRADEAAGNIAESVKRDAEIIDGCEDIANRCTERSERIKEIIREVEGRNKKNGA